MSEVKKVKSEMADPYIKAEDWLWLDIKAPNTDSVTKAIMKEGALVTFEDEEGIQLYGTFHRLILTPNYSPVALVTVCTSEDGGSPVTYWHYVTPEKLRSL